ncbi:MAG: lipoyl domain-containing protein, partial [Parasporobacterium sp.]|nr:lipoyl domain-containing protein [Parasporobacterium sp.]
MKIIMPQIGMTMNEGAITAWKKNEGDKVEQGEALFSIMTEKLENDNYYFTLFAECIFAL